MNLPVFKKLIEEIKNIIIITVIALTGLFILDYFEILEYMIDVIYISGFVIIIISFVIFIKFLINWHKNKRKFSKKAPDLIKGLMHMTTLLLKSAKFLLKGMKLLWPLILKAMKFLWPFILKFFNK